MQAKDCVAAFNAGRAANVCEIAFESYYIHRRDIESVLIPIVFRRLVMMPPQMLMINAEIVMYTDCVTVRLLNLTCSC